MTHYNELPMSISPAQFKKICDENDALREAVRVLGEECAAWSRWFVEAEGYDDDTFRAIVPLLVKSVWEATNANPIARAAVEGTL